MKRHTIAIAFGLVVALAATGAAQSAAGSKSYTATVTLPGAEQWMDLPAPALVGTPSVPVGGTLKVAILQGDPMTPGQPYVARVSCTAGSKVAPHTHPATENVTIIKGAFLMGMGAKWDDKALKEMPTGSFGSMGTGMAHFAQCKGDTVVQINGLAPLRFDFVAGTAAAQK